GELAPGECVVVVSDTAAFTARYGSGIRQAGQYNGHLDNSGERLVLKDASANTLLDFSYSNTWYPLTDGGGSSLVIVNPCADASTWGNKESWQASSQSGGTPGTNPPPVLTPPEFAAGASQGKVTNNHITEASGLVASRSNSGVLWTHNDGPGAATLYAINAQGDYLGAFTLAGVQATDCEDIALGPGPVAGVNYLYLGDIGDNNADRATIRIYRVPEPTVHADGGDQSQSLAGTEVFALVYPDGPKNAETLLCDPWSGDLYVISKTESPNGIYCVAAASLVSGPTITMTRVGSINFDRVDGGDISVTGCEILLRREDFAGLFSRSPGESVVAALAGLPFQVPVVGTPTEPNGEAIGFDPVGSGYYTLSEGKNQPLYYFRRTSIFSATRTWIGGADTNWMTPQNWFGGMSPQPGDTVVFSAAAGTETVNDFPAATSFSTLIFQGGDFTVSGNDLAIAAGGTTVEVDAGAACTFGIALTGTGGGITKTGPGTLVLSGVNTYSGITINGGAISVASPAAMPAGGAMIFAGGNLLLNFGGGGGTVTSAAVAVSSQSGASTTSDFSAAVAVAVPALGTTKMAVSSIEQTTPGVAQRSASSDPPVGDHVAVTQEPDLSQRLPSLACPTVFSALLDKPGTDRRLVVAPNPTYKDCWTTKASDVSIVGTFRQALLSAANDRTLAHDMVLREETDASRPRQAWTPGGDGSKSASQLVELATVESVVRSRHLDDAYRHHGRKRNEEQDPLSYGST
ncbi:MAG: autotransporter-associated beta strand repeat-containing protein, partial [Thermoguttaceae bacterium]